MMNRNELRALMERLEALEALAKLFNNLWFDRIRQDIRDPKVQAYLTVFDDAFPHMNHVIEFVRRSARMLSSEADGRQQWARLQHEFDDLHRMLKNEPDDGLAPSSPPAEPVATAAAPTDLSVEERSALERVDQNDIDSLFTDAGEEEEVDEEDDSGRDIDALLDTTEKDQELAPAEMDALFADVEEEEEETDSIVGEMIDEDEDLDEAEALAQAEELETELGEETEEESGELTGEEDGTGELEELLEGVDEQEISDEDVELADLLAEEGDGEAEAEEEDGQIGGIGTEDADDAGVQALEELDDELFADEDTSQEEDPEAVDVDVEEIFSEEEEEEELDLGDLLEEDAQEGAEDVAPGISEDEMSALLDDEEEKKDTVTKSPKKKEKADDDEESSISQDEIDALFG